MDTIAILKRKVEFQVEQQPTVEPSLVQTKVAGTRTPGNADIFGPGSNNEDEGTDHASSNIVGSEGGLVIAPSHTHNTATALRLTRKNLSVVRIKLPGRVQNFRFTAAGSADVTGNVFEISVARKKFGVWVSVCGDMDNCQTWTSRLPLLRDTRIIDDALWIQSENMPIFEQGGNWHLVKLLKGPVGVPEVKQKALEQRFVSIFEDSGYKVRSNSFDGKQTGAKELHYMGVSTESPARIGPENADIAGTMAMAGFPQSSYSLKREALLPPLELQRQVFPFIEGLHGPMDPDQWKAHCDRVMMDFSPFLDEETVQGAGRQRRIAAAKESLDVYSGVARLDLIHLLLWMRRIVLQDGALFLQDGATNRLLERGVFRQAEFRQFQSDLIRAMGTHSGNPCQDQELYRELNVSTSQNVAPSLSDSEAGQIGAGSMIEAPQQEEGIGYWITHGNHHELCKRPPSMAESEEGKQESPPSQQQQLQEQVAGLQQQVEEQAQMIRQQMEQQEKERQQRETEYRRILDQLSQQTRLAEELKQRLDGQQRMILPRSPLSPPADGMAVGGKSLDPIVRGRTPHIQNPSLGRVAPSSVISAALLETNDPSAMAPKSLPGAVPEQTRPMHGPQSGRGPIMTFPSKKSQPVQFPPGSVSPSKPGPASPNLRRRNSSGGATKRKSRIRWSRRRKTSIQVTPQGAFQTVFKSGFPVSAQELHCFCRKPDDGGFMIACDKCD
ncbi:hypothetical protein BGZ81_007889, partial [Podila clonocystis]